MKIYRIKNIINGKSYVGKTEKTIKDRFSIHLLNSKNKVNNHLYNAMKYYGHNNFKIEELEVCSSVKNLNEREKYWIKNYNTTDRKYGYNIALGGTGGDTFTKQNKEKKKQIIEKRRKSMMGKNKGKKCTEKQKENLRKLYKDKTYEEIHGEKKAKEIRQKISSSNKISQKKLYLNGYINPMKGKKQSPETIEKRSKALSGRILSLQHRKNISKGKKGKKWTEKRRNSQLKKSKNNRRFCIGDIHGNIKLLKEVLVKSKFNYDEDLLIILGDVVDGYNCSYEVIEELIKVKNKVFIIGNHDFWWMNYITNGWAESIWKSQGGKATLDSYKHNGYNYKMLPESHKDFFNSGVYYYELDNMLFMHGGFDYPTHPKNSSIQMLTWDRSLIERFKNGLKIKEWNKIFVGHTSTEGDKAEPLIVDEHNGKFAKLINIDCGAGWKGRLCIYDIDSDEYTLSSFAGGHECQ